jgi:hypothetical protein
MPTSLKAVAQSRHDGFWELLATAAGQPASIAKSTGGLSAEALDACFDGPAVSPSIVQARVEAVAALDVGMLVALARAWRRPRELRADLGEVTTDFWASAWCAAMRHLHRQGAITRADVASELYMTEREAAVVFCPEPRPKVRWADVVAQISRGELDYRGARHLDCGGLVESRIGAGDLIPLFEHDRSAVRLSAFRILRSRTHLIDEGARNLLSQQLWKGWQEPFDLANDKSGELRDLQILTELGVECGLAIVEPVATRMAELLERQASPDLAAPLAYVLLGTGWQSP